MGEVLRYSEAFKLRLAGDVASGKCASIYEARRRNGIRRASTVSKRVKKYGREDILPKRVKAGMDLTPSGRQKDKREIQRKRRKRRESKRKNGGCTPGNSRPKRQRRQKSTGNR
jgi:replication initiation and membrane attachment protein DnaB